MKKRQIAERLAKFYLRHGRGHSLLDFLIAIVKNVVYFGALGALITYWFHWTLSKFLLIGLALVYEVICYLLGWLDEILGFWKIQNNYSSKELTPFLEEMYNDIKEIKNGI